jgi:hypothetical protein
MKDQDVKLPWGTILMDSLDPSNPDDAGVIEIIERVQRKALRCSGNPLRINEESSQRVDTPPVSVTKLRPVDSARVNPKGGRPRKYASRAEQQAAYRERKAALAIVSA